MGDHRALCVKSVRIWNWYNKRLSARASNTILCAVMTAISSLVIDWRETGETDMPAPEQSYESACPELMDTSGEPTSHRTTR